MPIGEPPAWTQARMARMTQRFPQLDVASPSSILEVDAHYAAQGGAPTDFTQAALNVANYAVTQLPVRSPSAGAASDSAAAPEGVMAPVLGVPRLPTKTATRSVFNG